MRRIILLVLDQKIPKWLVKITLLGEVENELNQVLNLALVSWANDAIFVLWFLFNDSLLLIRLSLTEM